MNNNRAGFSAGFVLVMIMVFLMVASMLGVASVRSSRFEGMMAKNHYLQNVSFQHAESVAGVSENQWQALLLECITQLDACDKEVLHNLDPPERDGLSRRSGVINYNWRDASVSEVGGVGLSVVEFLGRREVPGDDGKRMYVYRLTSRGVDDSGGHMVHLQTIYRLCLNIDGSPCPG